MRILIVDDSVLLREGLRLLLTEDGHDVIGVLGDGDALVAQALALRPDLEAPLTGDKSNTVVFDNALVKALVPQFDASTTFAEGVRRAVAWLEAHPQERRTDPAFDAFCDGVVAKVAAWG